MSTADGTPLLIFPYNGNALEAWDSLERAGERGGHYRLIGFVDDTVALQGPLAGGLRVESRAAFEREPDAAVLAVFGGPGSFQRRREVTLGLDLAPHRWARVIDPSARVSPRAHVGVDVWIGAGVVVACHAWIGDHVCLLANTVVHHHARVEDWCLVGSNVTIAGNTIVGVNAYVGSGASLMHGIRIGAGTLVGLGACVVHDVAAGRRVVGNPHRDLD
jgi:sugar O-acyltransferase (sialic acid O-acetyltransferase NeuD family)